MHAIIPPVGTNQAHPDQTLVVHRAGMAARIALV